MSFLYPLALAFLGLLPMIVLLHLLRERHRPVVMSSLMHWLRLVEPAQGPRWRRLPITFLLLLHLLVAALLALALARPEIPAFATWGQPTHTIWILDSSSSMAATDVSPSRWEAAVSEIRQGIQSMSPRDASTLIEMGPKAEVLIRGEPGERQAFFTVLAARRPGGAGSDLSGALEIAKDGLRPGFNNRIVVYTDGAFHIPANRQEYAVAPAPITWRTFGKTTANQGIVTFSSRRLPNGGAQILARIANFSANAIQRGVRLSADPQPDGSGGRPLDSATVLLPAEGEAEQSWAAPPGVKVVQAELLGHDALPDDDRAVLSLAGQDRLPAVLVQPVASSTGGSTQSSGALERALRALPGLDVRMVNPADYHPSPDVALSILDGFLPELPPPGNVLVINPPADRDWLPVIGDTARLRPAPGEDPLVAGIDLSSVHLDQIQRLNWPGWTRPVLVATRSGREVEASPALPLIARGQISQTQVIVWAFDPERSNLPNKLAFPLLVARSVAELLPPRLPAVAPAGQPVWLPAGSSEMTGGTGGVMHVIPGQALTPHQPGLYTVRGEWPDGHTWQGQFAVNAGDAVESDIRPVQRDLESQVSSRAPAGGPARPSQLVTNQAEIWPVLAALAVLALAVEGWWAWR